MASPDVGLLVDGVSGLLLLALAAFVATRRPVRAPHLLLAAFSGLWGGGKLVSNWVRAFGLDAGTVVTVADAVFIVAALLLLALVDRFPFQSRTHPRFVAGTLLGAAALVFLAEAMAGPMQRAEGELAGNVAILSAAVVAAGSLALRHGRVRGSVRAPQRTLMRLMAAALVLDPGLRVGLRLITEYPGGLPALVVLVLVSGLWLRAAARAPSLREARGARNLALLVLALPLLGMSLQTLFRGADLFNAGLFGVVRALTVAILAYAILRHQLLGIDVKVKWTLKQSTVAAVFIAVFFVVSEGAAALFEAQTGSTAAGVLAAGALVFALAPLQRLADRVADRAMPDVKSVGEMTDTERQRAYRDAVGTAWRDGTIDANERLLLDRLRESLGIPVEEAYRLENEAAALTVQHVR